MGSREAAHIFYISSGISGEENPGFVPKIGFSINA